ALNALASLGTYVWQTVWPSGLSVFYPHAAIVAPEPARALLGPAALGLVLLLALSVGAWRARKRAPTMAFGWYAFLVLLLPVIGLVQVGTQAHADRYTYLPSAGLALALTAAAGLVPWRAALAAPLGLALSVALGTATRQQLGCWSDAKALFEHALALD